jgi:hypothetical protein
MIALHIKELKNFMDKLLRSDLFHHFLLEEAVICSGGTYTVDGHINRDFFTGDDETLMRLEGLDCLPFSMLQPLCFSMIKGAKPPISFQFTFKLSPENQKNTLHALESVFTQSDINGLYLNFRFQSGQLLCTPAISYRSFSLDHSLDRQWDELTKKFLLRHEIAFDEM